MHNFPRIFIKSDFCVFLALSFFVVPVQWVLGWMIAAFVHELFHLLIMLILKIRVLSISVGASGVVIQSDFLTSAQELLCALAGPFGGLIAALLIVIIPHVGVSAAIQTIYNLLPVYPLDGGRAVKCIATCFLGEDKATRISNAINILSIVLITFAGIWLPRKYQTGYIILVLLLLFMICKNSLQSS